MFHLIVTIAPKTSDDVVPVFDALSRRRALCLSEPGCLHWEAYQSLDSPQEFVLVEHWESRAHGEAHGHLPAIQDIHLPEVLPRVTRIARPSKPLGHAA